MKRSIIALVLGIALVAAACAESPSGASDTTAPTTTFAAPTTAAAETTTTAPAPSTTAAEETTTSAAERASEADALFASMTPIERLTSARVEGSLELKGLDPAESGVSEAAIVFATSFDNDTGDGSFLMDMSSFASAFESEEDAPFDPSLIGTMEMRQVGETAYLKFPLLTMMLGAETEWVSMSADESDGFVKSPDQMPTDPADVLDSYQGADATVDDLGVEEVNGVQATHYRITFDTESLLDELSAAERKQLDEALYFGVGDIPIDLWITDEGYLVRMLLAFDGSMLGPEAEGGVGSMAMRFDVFDINQPITVTPPPADQVTSADDLDAGALFDFSTEA